LAGLVATAFTALAYALFRWDVVLELTLRSGLNGFNFGRFHWLQPGLWLVSFSAALFVLARAFDQPRRPLAPGRGLAGAGWWIAFGLAGAQIVSNVQGLPAYGGAPRSMPFDRFFATDVFPEIEAALEADGSFERIGMVGVHPAIAQYHGLPTLGAYMQMYPIEEKRRFRQIIAAELERSERLRTSFDTWGSRAYLFSADLGRCGGNCFVGRAAESIELRLDYDAFREAGGTHILSVSPIVNDAPLDLLLSVEQTASAGVDHWRFFLYALR
jgi:hypothetical protein